MLFPVFTLLVSLVGSGVATVADTDKEESLMCEISPDGASLRFDFRLILNTDPNNRLIALDQVNYALTPSVYTSTPCSATFAGNSYHVETTVDLASQSGTNLCGMTEVAVTNGWGYKIVLLHQTGDNENLLESKDRVYILECTSANSVENSVTSNVQVEKPVQKPVVVYQALPTLSILRPVPLSGNFVPLTPSDRLAVGSLIKLQLAYTYGTFSTARYYGVAGLLTQVSQNPNFNDYIEFFDDKGCPADNLAPNAGFTVADTGASQPIGSRTFIQRTEAFPLWLWDKAPKAKMYFKVYYDLCHGVSGFNGDNLCIDPCLHLSNQRRRREIENGLNSTVIVIEVYDPAAEESGEKQHQQSNSVTGLLIGVIVGCVILCALIGALLIAFLCARKRSSAKKEEKCCPAEFENKAHMNY